MKKFAANYLYTNTGELLKNGIIVADDDGFVSELIDTHGDIREIAQLTFLNGILLSGCRFVKSNQANINSDKPFESLVKDCVAGVSRFSIPEMIDLGKQVQLQFQKMKIQEILNKISETLQMGEGFSKETCAGIYLLTGVDLVNLHFLPQSRLTKLL